jgi:nucleoid-associated protein YgaU
MLVSLAACATRPSLHRDKAIASLDRVTGEGGEYLLPAQYRSLIDVIVRGENLLEHKKIEEADRQFELAILKGALLEKEAREERARREEAARLAEEQKRAELKRQAREAAERLAQEQAQAAEQVQKEAVEHERKKPRPPQKEVQQVTSYTVRRGETLPLIASQPQVYGDTSLWPLIYRANRDQIGDPRHVWPGQVLRIPRNIGRDDIAEARRYAQRGLR